MKNSTLSAGTASNSYKNADYSTRQIIVEIISALFIVLFLYTSVSKLIYFEGFILDMNKQKFPDWIKPFLTWAVPSIEILIVLLLIYIKTRTIGLWSSFVIMFLFTVYTAAVLLNLLGKAPCSCGGVIRSLTWKQHLIFNLFFVGLSLAAIKLNRPGETKKSV